MQIILPLVALLVPLVAAVTGASATDRQDEIRACIENKISLLVANKSKGFTSPELDQTCPNPEGVINCVSERTGRFGWRIPDAEASHFAIDSGSVGWTETNNNSGDATDLVTEPDHKSSSVRLHCKRDKCFGGRAWIHGTISGRLIYLPDLDDKRHMAAACLHP
jgi:hypothetical protein